MRSTITKKFVNTESGKKKNESHIFTLNLPQRLHLRRLNKHFSYLKIFYLLYVENYKTKMQKQ